MPLVREPIFRLPTTWSTAIAGAVAVHHFEGEVTVLEMNKMQAIGDEWYRRYPGKSLSIAVVFPTTHRASAEQRDRMRQLIKHWEGKHLAAANAMLMDGLLGAMHRSILTGILMFAPPPHPSKVFAAVEPAVSWLLDHQLGTALSAAEVLTAINQTSNEFLARPGRVAL